MPAIQSNPAFLKGTWASIQNNSHLWSDIQQELRHAVIFFPERKRKEFFGDNIPSES